MKGGRKLWVCYGDTLPTEMVYAPLGPRAPHSLTRPLSQVNDEVSKSKGLFPPARQPGLTPGAGPTLRSVKTGI